MLAWFKRLLLKPHLALSEQLRHTHQAIDSQMRQTQQVIDLRMRQIVAEPVMKSQQAIGEELGEARQMVESLASAVDVLRGHAEALGARFAAAEQRADAERHERNERQKRHAKDVRQMLSAVLARSVMDGKDRGQVYFDALHAVGVLNYENDSVSGERRFLRRLFDRHPAATVFDVGANEGQYSRLVRELAPTAVVHAFEPSPVSFAELARVAADIGIIAHPVALSDSGGDIEIYDYADEAGSQHASVYREVIENVHRRPASAWTVRCQTLDTMADELSVGSIGLLKIDTEGHELSVLRGARRLLASDAIDIVQFEFNEMNVISRVFMRDFFLLLPNYRIFRLLSHGAIPFETYDPRFMEVFAYQNIVCIRRDLDSSWVHDDGEDA